MSNLISPSHHIITCPSSMQLHPSTASSLHAFIPTNRVQPISIHISAVSQAAQNKQCCTVFHLLWMPSTWGGILRPVGCRRVQWPCGGGVIWSCLSLLCPTYTNDKRNSEESNKRNVQWMDIREGTLSLEDPVHWLQGYVSAVSYSKPPPSPLEAKKFSIFTHLKPIHTHSKSFIIFLQVQRLSAPQQDGASKPVLCKPQIFTWGAVQLRKKIHFHM